MDVYLQNLIWSIITEFEMIACQHEILELVGLIFAYAVVFRPDPFWLPLPENWKTTCTALLSDRIIKNVFVLGLFMHQKISSAQCLENFARNCKEHEWAIAGIFWSAEAMKLL